MSIIGPRPLLVSYLPWYTEEEKQRHDVRPGLSGLAVFNSWFIIEAVEIWKIRKNTVFCSDRIICFRKHRFWIYCIYTDIRKKNV